MSVEDSLCDRVQLALVSGTLDEALRSHLDACDECAFVAAASRRLGAAAAAVPEGTFAIEQLLAALAQAGEPLLGRYRLDRRLGRGGQGVVWRARDLDSGEDVAVKVVTGEVSSDEVVNAHRVRHPAVCRVYHSERHGRLRVIVMELIEGRALAELLPMPLSRALPIFVEIATALDAGHEAGVLHLDLKPENVLVQGDGRPVVTDFGLSVRGDDARALGGTAAYMAPEARDGGKVDRRADIYALGILLEKMVASPPAWLRRTITRATARDPAARPATVKDLIRAVDRPRRRRRIARSLGLAFATLGVATVAIILLAPAPAGGRAPWRADLWGVDRVPSDLWNVALNREGRGPPAVVPDGRGFGCAHKPHELVDGLTVYSDWEHGFAFAGRTPICVSLAMIDYCGGRVPGRPECDGGKGQVDPAGDCRERSITVDLGRPHLVSAVRTWYHGGPMVPSALRIQAESDDGNLVDVFATRDNREGMDPRWYPGGMGASVPVTNEFAPVRTRRVRIVVDPCSTLRDGVPGTTGDVVWFYEIEVFARVGRLDAWRRKLFDRSS